MSETNNGIPLDPAEAVEAVKNKQIEITEDSGLVDSGPIYETFSITVKDDDGKVVYDSEGPRQPFYWVKVGNFPAVLETEGAELTDEQVDFIGKALSGEKTGKALKSLIAMYNSVQRANAKQAEYARITNLKKPMSEETKAKKIEQTVMLFSSMNNISAEKAREMLRAAGLIPA